MEQILLLNPEHATEAEVAQFTVREAARAVVFDADGNVALLYVGRDEYYKLPGGGIDAGESKEEALRRECLEEIGCDVEIVRELGTIIEYRKMFNIKQISYCYAAKVIGEKGEPKYTAHEIERGFKKLWVPYEEALRLMRESKAKSPEGAMYIVPRDVAVLSASI